MKLPESPRQLDSLRLAMDSTFSAVKGYPEEHCNSAPEEFFWFGENGFGQGELRFCTWASGLGQFCPRQGYPRTQKQAGFFEGSLRYVISRYSSRSGKAIEREQVNILLHRKSAQHPIAGYGWRLC